MIRMLCLLAIAGIGLLAADAPPPAGPATSAPPAEIVLDRLLLTDGRQLVGRYDADAGRIALCDERTGRPMGAIDVAKDQIAGAGKVTIVPPTAPAGPTLPRGLDGQWLTNHAAAVKAAKEADVWIMALFTGSDWCPWCVKLEREILNTKVFRDWARGRIVLLYLDFPNKPIGANLKAQNDQLQGKYAVRGFPSIVFLKADGTAHPWRWGYKEGGPEAWTAAVDRSLGLPPPKR